MLAPRCRSWVLAYSLGRCILICNADFDSSHRYSQLTAHQSSTTEHTAHTMEHLMTAQLDPAQPTVGQLDRPKVGHSLSYPPA
jgi:hypothetical protein